ncbi:MAG: hypothetical protein KAS36_01730 [Anaerolineales bacterium]|nr:hypothetical protein [Anaerolineales bacterium]
MGYRFGKPFGEMPRLFIELSKKGHKVYNHGQKIADDGVTVTLSPTHREVRLPLALLENPERVFVTVKTNSKGMPLDNTPWIFIDLRNEISL